MNTKATRRGAVFSIERVFREVNAGRLDFGEWVSAKLAYAIGNFGRGAYFLSKVVAKDALAPTDERRNFSQVAEHSLETLWRAFEIARKDPIRPFPHLGPVILH